MFTKKYVLFIFLCLSTGYSFCMEEQENFSEVVNTLALFMHASKQCNIITIQKKLNASRELQKIEQAQQTSAAPSRWEPAEKHVLFLIDKIKDIALEGPENGELAMNILIHMNLRSLQFSEEIQLSSDNKEKIILLFDEKHYVGKLAQLCQNNFPIDNVTFQDNGNSDAYSAYVNNVAQLLKAHVSKILNEENVQAKIDSALKQMQIS